MLIPSTTIAEPNTANIATSIYKETTYKTAPVYPVEAFPAGNAQSKPEPIKTQPSIHAEVQSIQTTDLVSIDPLTEIIRRESGGNLLAINSSSGACGLFQSLPCSKMLDWIGVTSLEQATYEQQTAWGMMYITVRYGNAENALAFHNSHGWY